MDSISDPLPLGHFPEDFPSVMLPEPPSSGGGSSSFTALLGLPPEQAIELLHAVPDPRVKPEPAESGSASPRRPLKRKDSAEPPKARPNGAKKGRGSDADEKLPYVHVRARRGQATDSHSLAERARREKINARMKLLQELVPGCNKISGTASVLDEIINHVQSLQRQVEFLSMRLAAVNPMFDCSVESFLSSDDLRLAGGNCGLRLIGNFDGLRHQQQLWQLDNQVATSLSPSLWDRDSDHLHHEHPHAFLRYDAASRATVNSNQMKMEL